MDYYNSLSTAPSDFLVHPTDFFIFVAMLYSLTVMNHLDFPIIIGEGKTKNLWMTTEQKEVSRQTEKPLFILEIKNYL